MDIKVVWSDVIFDGILETLASKTGRSTRMWRLLAVRG